MFLAVAFPLWLNINRSAHFFSNTVKLLILLPEFCSFELKAISIMEASSCPYHQQLHLFPTIVIQTIFTEDQNVKCLSVQL